MRSRGDAGAGDVDAAATPTVGGGVGVVDFRIGISRDNVSESSRRIDVAGAGGGDGVSAFGSSRDNVSELFFDLLDDSADDDDDDAFDVELSGSAVRRGTLGDEDEVLVVDSLTVDVTTTAVVVVAVEPLVLRGDVAECEWRRDDDDDDASVEW